MPTAVADWDYELIEEVGRGGSGVVWKARQISLHRVVAIKFPIHGGYASERVRRRFRAEAEAVAALSHPGIVPIHEVGERHGELYFTMDYFEGGSLAAKVQGRPLASADAARMVERASEAAHHAHERGIIHRDLKPSNLLLDAEGRPHLSDFGLARQLDREVGLTVSGDILGTPNYMPPEQASGMARTNAATNDVYSLGAILYHLLTGRPPFVAETVEATLLQVVHQEPVAPRQLNPNIHRDLETICLKCLQKRPERRYPTARALGEDLRRWLAGEIILARPVGRAEYVLRWAQRHPVEATLAAGMVLSLALGFLGITRALRLAKAEASRADHKAYVADMRLATRLLADGRLQSVRETLSQHAPRSKRPDQRGWEWRYLDARTVASSGRLIGSHSNLVTRVALSPDGRSIASVGLDQQWKIWDRFSSHLTVDVHMPEALNGLAWSGDGAWIAACGRPGSVYLRHQSTGEIRDLRPKCPAYEVAFSPDSRLLAAVGAPVDDRRGMLRVMETASGQALLEIPVTGSDMGCSGLAFSPNGRWLAYADAGSIHVRDLVARATCARLECNPEAVAACAFSADSRFLAGVSGRNERRSMGGLTSLPAGWTTVWATETWRPVASLVHNVSTDEGGFAQFSPDGSVLMTVAHSPGLQLWDTVSWNPLGPALAGSGVAAFAPGTGDLLAARHDRILELPDPTLEPATYLPPVSGERMSALSSLGRWFLRLATNRSGELVLSVGTSRPLREDHRIPLGARGKPRSMDIAVDGTVAAGYPTGELHFWDGTGRERSLVIGTRTDDPHLAFSPRGDRLAYTASGDEIHLVRFPSQQRIQSLSRLPIGLRMMLFSPDDRYLAVAYEAEPRLEVWELASGQRIVSLIPLHDTVTDVQFLPDRETLLASSYGGRPAAIHLTTGQLRRDLKLPDHVRIAIAVSPDGRRLLTPMSNIPSIAIWDLETGELTGELLTHIGEVRRLAFDPTGSHVVAIGRGEVEVWSASRAPP